MKEEQEHKHDVQISWARNFSDHASNMPNYQNRNQDKGNQCVAIMHATRLAHISKR